MGVLIHASKQTENEEIPITPVLYKQLSYEENTSSSTAQKCPADGFLGLGKLTIQFQCQSGYSHSLWHSYWHKWSWLAISLTAAVNCKADCTKQLIGSICDAEVEQCAANPIYPEGTPQDKDFGHNWYAKISAEASTQCCRMQLGCCFSATGPCLQEHLTNKYPEYLGCESTGPRDFWGFSLLASHHKWRLLSRTVSELQCACFFGGPGITFISPDITSSRDLS